MTEATFRSDMHVKVIDHMGDDLSPVRAARVSTFGAASQDSTENKGLLRFLMREGHMVPFETQIMTFYIEAPIFVTRQILKHRISSISEESGRYRVLNTEFYVPGSARSVKQVGKTGDYQFEHDRHLLDSAQRTIQHVSRNAAVNYESLLNLGVAKEVARMMLPLNTYSSMYLTMNSVALMNFLRLRLSYWGSHPQYEIEQVAKQMYLLWAEAFPETSQAWTDKMDG